MPSAASSVPALTVSSACSSGERVGRRGVPHVVERLPAEPHDRRRLGRQGRRQLVDGRVELADRHHPVDEADLGGLGRGDAPAGHHQLERLLGRHRAHQWHRDHVRPQPDVDLGCAEHRVVGRDHEIAGQRQAHPAGQRVAADPGDGGLAEVPQVAEEPGDLAPAVVQVEVAGARRPCRSRSAPAQNALSPAPVSTTTRASGSPRISASRARSVGEHGPRQRVALAPGRSIVEPGDAVGQLVAQLGARVGSPPPPAAAPASPATRGPPARPHPQPIEPFAAAVGIRAQALRRS